MRAFPSIRLIVILLVLGSFWFAGPGLHAQEEETPLGDVARQFRKKAAAAEPVIDNDNLTKVMDDAEAHRASGAAPVFSLEPGGKGFQVASPDVVCSLSFSSKATALLADPIMLDELPRSELAKLDGPASLDGDNLEITLHNGSAWELREATIGLTIVRQADPDDKTSSLGRARIVPAVEGSAPQTVQEQKHADVTILLHVKGSAAPDATATFRAPLNFALFPDQDWHWAVVRAKGIAPPVPTALPVPTETPAPTMPPVTAPMLAQP